MTVSVVCSGCSKTLRGPDELAGRTIRCPSCKNRMVIPPLAPPPPAPVQEVVDDDDDFQLLPEETRVTAPIPQIFKALPPTSEAEANELCGHTRWSLAESQPTLPKFAEELPAPEDPTPSQWIHLCWVFAVALVPLMILLVGSLFSEKVLSSASHEFTEDEIRILNEVSAAKSQGVEPSEGLKQAVAEIIERHQEVDPLLASDSVMHWPMAFASALLFLGVISLMGLDGTAKPWQLAVMGILSATVGVMFLLVLQMVAIWSLSLPWVRGYGPGLIIGLLKFIGFSYYAALDPDTGFLVSFLGFVFGVGLCEEVVKVLPVYVFYRSGGKLTGRGAMLWGLALGAGFGIAEGILYSADHYNGRSTSGIYFVRFLSCVSLHAMWTAMAATMISLKLDLEIDRSEWAEWLKAFAITMGGPMVLHGLYDTFLKKDQMLLALLTAIVTFALYAWMVYRGRTVLENVLLYSTEYQP